MDKTLANAKLGIFIFLGSTLLVIGIFLLGNKDQLFASTFTVKAYFETIEGLRNGASVRFGGIDVGAVKEIKILDDTSGRVEVSMRIKTDIKRFIRKNSVATIETEGLVGNKIVMLTMGSENFEPIADGGTIQSREPLGFAAVIEETQGILAYTKEMTKNLSDIMDRINKGEGTIGKILTDDELYYAATKLTKSADKSLVNLTDDLKDVLELFDKLGSGVENVVENVNKVVADIDSLMVGVQEGKGLMGSLLTDKGKEAESLNQILENIVQVTEESKLGASRLAENMEALKHNWLFKSYYENRGYWDKAEFEVQIDSKILELDRKIKLLDEKINELKTLERANK
ncbi:MAG TPA: MlaD family protein [Ignavibacteriaceae bacterium]|nr:MlaD family protein [Ignavibacteriaceae bacterium]